MIHRRSITTTGTITWKDTSPFIEGHETKQYLGGRKSKSAWRKNHRISQGNGQKPNPTIIDRAELW